ncbi:MAG: 1,4-dihydroxy-2-naphthoate polyprenyltransferase [Pseudonocardia sp.]|nr:1,4-dihydroxy-2-naphthoate polyprenyltransferase [Pseudonocardia sp.]
MATTAQWISGARPRTLPNALSPVLVGTGATIGTGSTRPGLAALALVVAVSLVVGVNYANDYSDGLRGTDNDRLGPTRLVGSSAASPAAVRTAALVWLSLAALAGVALVALSGRWWLLGVGAICLAAAWFYTGGQRPYGYQGLGEVAVFVFFGPVAVLGTAYTQGRPPGAMPLIASIGVGMLSASVLVANNLRDISTDAAVGKRSLAVILGDTGTRRLYVVLVLTPLALSVITAPDHPTMLLALLATPLAWSPVRAVLSGAVGRRLIGVLGGTGVFMLAWSVGTAIGLALAKPV